MAGTNEAGRKRLEGKVAVVTGAGRGIGRAEALLLAREGAKVVVNDIGGQPYGMAGYSGVAANVVDEIRALGGEAVAETSSIDGVAGAQAVVQAAIEAFGRIDILSNNAAVARPARIDLMSEADWDAVVSVSLKGYFATIRAAAPYFIAQRSGVIVNKSSPSGFGHYGMANYSAAKEGVAGLTRTVARDLGEFGVRCNALRPMAIDAMSVDGIGPTIEHSQNAGYPGLWNRWIGAFPAVPPLSEHVAAVTVWLCGEQARQLNGREIFIAGTEIGIFPEPELFRSSFNPDGWTLESLEDPVFVDYLTGDARNRFSSGSTS